MPVNQIAIEQSLCRPLRGRRGPQTVEPDKIARERFGSSQFGREPL